MRTFSCIMCPAACTLTAGEKPELPVKAGGLVITRWQGTGRSVLDIRDMRRRYVRTW
ncbi:MAG: hypothetical protein LBH70_00650 [Spirochaetaceae bacterium]|jgi:CxxC motif-containing protein|nr:hypothetical protein [Spirochaetaceae bacterium]